ncbi:MAG TPA: acyl-CoA dehydrogenase family protein [Acidimicrobiales bacterium]|nr:acyl-CoA dehydrogenase family protein [Acidimicrobiales bacterium]
MDFEHDPATEAFRAEVRAFLAEHLPPELEDHLYATGAYHDDDFVRSLGARNWIAPEWEREDGQVPLDHMRVHVLTEELTRVEAPIHASATSVMVARVIRAIGSDWLRDLVVPAVLRGETTIALGLSEPEAGSDVAAVRTRARRAGDGWVIDGQKMFTTSGHLADYVFLLTRTDPGSERHRGLTTFLVPTDSAGIEVQPVHTVSGERTNITFYGEVRLDDRWRIGEVGQGWGALMLAMQEEHSAPFGPHLDRFVGLVEEWAAAEEDGTGARPLDRDEVRQRLVRAATDREVGLLLDARVSWMEANGEPPVAEGSMTKLFNTEALVRAAEDLLALMGPDGLRTRGDATAVLGGRIEQAMRFSIGATIQAGTSEIHRNIIANFRCRLPRG